MRLALLATLAMMAAGCAGAYAASHAHMTAENGMTLYIFDKDTADTSVCYDDCAVNWPPYMADNGTTMPGLDAIETQGWQQAVGKGRQAALLLGWRYRAGRDQWRWRRRRLARRTLKRKSGGGPRARLSRPSAAALRPRGRRIATLAELVNIRAQPVKSGLRSQFVHAGWNHAAADRDEARVTTPHQFGPDQFKSEMIGLLPRMRRFAVTLTRSAPDADDLVQDACATALQKWHHYDPRPTAGPVDVPHHPQSLDQRDPQAPGPPGAGPYPCGRRRPSCRPRTPTMRSRPGRFRARSTLCLRSLRSP